MTRGEALAAHTETWIGVPFHWQGRSRIGADCKGWIAGCMAELGYPEADTIFAGAADYGNVVPAARLRAGLAEMFDLVGDRRPGDILLIKLGGTAQHLAVAAPRERVPLRVIEALAEYKKVTPFRRGASEVDSIWRLRGEPG